MMDLAPVDRGIEYLKDYQKLKAEQDDSSSKNIMESAIYMASLRTLIPMKVRLADLGRSLEREGKISPEYGDDYAEAALDFVLAEHGL